MMKFPETLRSHGLELRRTNAEVLQLNLGKLCNLTCTHCHVNAGPMRKEIMTRETVEKILTWVEANPILTVDLTGGAPEMIPYFRYLIERLRQSTHVQTIIDRCNLTILVEPGYEWLTNFLVANRIKVVASMPCYQPENVNAQRGEGVFDRSIQALQLLNQAGYGIDPNLQLDLVYNPNGAKLPPPQQELEADYKRELEIHFGIHFHHLYTITNLPISRYASWLKAQNQFQSYMDLLRDSFNPASVDKLMCRATISVDWAGHVYDCDFNQQLKMHRLSLKGEPLFLWDLNEEHLNSGPILIGEHCFGCTAGSGSSCGGALI